MECLEILKKYIGYQKYLFPWKEKKIKACSKKHVDFNYPNSLDDFNACLDLIQRKKKLFVIMIFLWEKALY